MGNVLVALFDGVPPGDILVKTLEQLLSPRNPVVVILLTFVFSKQDGSCPLVFQGMEVMSMWVSKDPSMFLRGESRKRIHAMYGFSTLCLAKFDNLNGGITGSFCSRFVL